MKRIIANSWIPYSKPNSHLPLRLFCFPYAGAGASIFCPWTAQLAPDIEVVPVQLPGRENRLSEPLFTQISPLVEALSYHLLPYCDRPFALFGHSVGALVAFEFARYLRRHDYHQPLHLFISGREAPQLRPSSPPIHPLPDPEFIEKLRQYNGMPDTLLQNPELMALFIPILRADLAINENYNYYSEAPLNYPISAFAGLDDCEATQEEMAPWSQETCHQFTLNLVPGDHFFIKSQPLPILAAIFQKLTGVIKPET